MAKGELRVGKGEQPERIEDALYKGERSVEIGGEVFEIVSSQLTPGVDSAFILTEV